MAVLLMTVLLVGCTLDDDDEECCYRVLLHYRDVQMGIDEYNKNITQMRHLLYDSEGRFIKEYSYQGQDLMINDINEGDYIMLTVANATNEKTSISDYEMLMSQTMIQPRDTTGAYRGNTDQLYWNMKPFTVGIDPQRYNCDLSNIHCHLHVRVFWHKLPDYTGTFTMKLYDVPQDYEGGTNAYTLTNELNDTLSFPWWTNRSADHIIEVSPYNFELEGEFITARWHNRWKPVLQVFNGTKQVTAPIDLDGVFLQWDWYPDQHAVQDYWIQIEVYEDGGVYLSKWSKARILDWVDGGSISG